MNSIQCAHYDKIDVRVFEDTQSAMDPADGMPNLSYTFPLGKEGLRAREWQ